MIIGGFQKVTLLDYPGKIGATIFSVGCNFRCPFCYTKELVIPSLIKHHPRVSEKIIFNYLKTRREKIDGVVLCGGEPTSQKNLKKFIKKIKELKFLVKLDTNGYLPNILDDLIQNNLLDYVAMDIKSPKDKYQKYTGVEVDISRIERSIQILKSSKIDYEFRTTLAPGLTKEDIFKIVKWISPAKSYFLQEFITIKAIIDEKIKKFPILTRQEVEQVIYKISPNFNICKLR